MTKAIYDNIGINYTGTRRTDPKIAEQIYAKLHGAQSIVNIGAGTGSYEPEHIDLVAVEPSAEMIAQRKKDAAPVVKAFADHLPFEDHSFTHAMTVLSMHHWKNRAEAFKEINRVTKQRFLAITWNPKHDCFWLTRDYFPEIYEEDINIFPAMEELYRHFDEVEISPLMIPEDCKDGFLAAYWKRPEAYLNDGVRQAISAFAKMKDPSKGLRELKNDLESGKWKDKNQSILDKESLDVGYVIVSCKTRAVR